MMDANQVRQCALEIAEAAILEQVPSRHLWEGVPGPRITDEDEEAIRAELRVIAEGVASKLHRLLPPPVQPVWVPVPR